MKRDVYVVAEDHSVAPLSEMRTRTEPSKMVAHTHPDFARDGKKFDAALHPLGSHDFAKMIRFGSGGTASSAPSRAGETPELSGRAVGKVSPVLKHGTLGGVENNRGQDFLQALAEGRFPMHGGSGSPLV